jgi:hypothetical protein
VDRRVGEVPEAFQHEGVRNFSWAPDAGGCRHLAVVIGEPFEPYTQNVRERLQQIASRVSNLVALDVEPNPAVGGSTNPAPVTALDDLPELPNGHRARAFP